MPAYTNVNGTWHAAGQGTKGMFTRVGGSWHQVSNAYLNVAGVWRRFYFSDNVGPVAPTNVTSDFVNGGQCRLRWSNPVDSDFVRMHAECFLPGNSAPVWVQDVGGAPGSAQSVINSNLNPYYTIQTWVLTSFDANGNQGAQVSVNSMAWTGAARGRTPSPIAFDDIGGAEWSVNTPFNTTAVPTFIQSGGVFNVGGDGSGGERISQVYYGDQFWQQVRGANITGASIQLRAVSFPADSGVNQHDVAILPSRVASGLPNLFRTVLAGYAPDQSAAGSGFDIAATGPYLTLSGAGVQYGTWAIPAGMWPAFNSITNWARSLELNNSSASMFGAPNRSRDMTTLIDASFGNSPVTGMRITIAHDG